MNDDRKAFRARYVFPVCTAPIADGAIEIDGPRIAAVGSDVRGQDVVDLGNVAIVPGLVNAHTHLEFSGLAKPLGTPGMSLPQWIPLVLQHRRTSLGTDARAVSAGLQESIAAGTTALGDVATSDWRSAAELPPQRPTTVLFHEFIATSLTQARAAAESAEAFLQSQSARDDIVPALSPHAPYTVHPYLLSALVELSRKYRVAVAMHLAETREELELLHLSSGPFRELLTELGVWEGAEDARLPYVVEYLAELAKAPRALVIHGNYLDAEEIEFLAAHRQTMSVVYCPRTHAYFAHQPYPLARMLAAGASVALGTDSRASNPSLSVFEELKFAAHAHLGVDKTTLVRMATLGGAKALGLDEAIGTLEPGKRADFTAIALGDGDASDPHERLFAAESRVAGTCVGGQWLWR